MIDRKTKIAICILVLFGALMTFAVWQKLVSAEACPLAAQTCTPVRLQGYLGGCDNIYLKFLPVNSSTEINRFDILLGGDCARRACTKVGEAPANVTFFNHLGVGCGAGGTYTIRQVMTTGASCDAQYTGSVPHNRPCDQCGGGASARLATANGASFQSALAVDAVGVAFGVDFTTETVAGFDADPLQNGIQLPTTLGGVRAFINNIPVGLFYVSPKQINFHVPGGLTTGSHAMSVATPDGRTITGDVLINRNAPGVFTQLQNGSGTAMALWWVFRDGIPFRIYPPGQLAFRPGDRVFLIVYGTGVNSARATLRLNNRVYESLYAGDAPVFIGLDQMNFEIPLDQLWFGATGAQITVYDGTDFWLSNGFQVFGLPQ